MSVFLHPFIVYALGNYDTRPRIVDGYVLEVSFFLDFHSSTLL